MNLPDIWSGTKEEKMAASRISQIDHKKTPPTPTEIIERSTLTGLTRRRLFRRGAISVIGFAAAGLIAYEILANIPEDPMAVIKAETDRLGIKPSPGEQQLIAKTPFWNPGNRDVVTPADNQEVYARFDAATTFLQKSVNPKFQLTSQSFVPLYSTGILRFVMDNQQSTSLGADGLFGTLPTSQGGRVVFEIHTKANIILKETNTLTISMYLAHELEHVRSFTAFLNSLGTQMTADQKLEALHKKTSDPAELLREEARAYAIQSESLIWEYGLGYQGVMKVGLQADAAAYIKAGSTNDNPTWLSYIDRSYMNRAA